VEGTGELRSNLYWLPPTDYDRDTMSRGSLGTRCLVRAAGTVIPLAALLFVAAPASAAAKCQGKRATIVGTGADNKLKGTRKADVIVAKGGDDSVSGRGGKDRICGGGGKDRLRGGGGNDRLFGQAGNDKLTDTAGHNVLNGGAAADLCTGARGTKSFTARSSQSSPLRSQEPAREP
jgi:Ca2+-binding RTX toxin-like protein